MEKNKDIPGWYHRLSNLKTKPASQITFKQYCQENETRMRILYPFLPHDQIKGKLLSYWKRKQPPEHKSLERNGFMKHKKPLKHPVVHLLSRPSANSKVAPVKKTTLPPEWLSGAGSVKAGDKGGKTYKWRAFVLPNKVPEVISQPSNHERSILKNGREGVSSAREKRQPASRVSFTPQDQENLSPSLYSPPSPFVLSPISDGEQINKDASPHEEKDLRQNPPKVTSQSVKQSPEHPQANQKRKNKQTEAKQYPRTLLPDQIKTIDSSAQEKGEKIQSLSESAQSARFSPSKKRKVRDKRRRKVRKSPQEKDNPDNQPEPIPLSPQCLEPPTFGPVLSASPDPEEKRFCLFEDEWVKPKLTKRRSVNHSTKSPKTRSKNKKSSFSWSPAVVCSQTPNLKKSKHSLFSQDKAETYQRQKRSMVDKLTGQSAPRKVSRTTCKKQTKAADMENLSALGAGCHHSASLRYAAEVERDSRKRKSPNTGKIKVKKNQKHSCTFDANLTKNADLSTEEASINEKNENNTWCTTDVPETHAKNLRFHQTNAQNLCGKHRFSHVTTELGTSKSPDGKMSKHLQQNDEDSPVSKIRLQSPTESDDDPKENTNIPRNQASKVPKPMGKTNNRNNTGHRNPLKQKQSSNQFNLRQSDEEATPENSPSKPFPSSESRSHSDPNPKAIDEGSNYDPHSLEGTSVLWQILFQLKGTAASSQGQNNPPSSPAQSRITEVSELSVKSPSSYAPSPVSQDLMDDCGPTAEEEFPMKKTLTMTNTGSSYRKRGNILCNMFEEPDQETAVPAKVRRYLPSETCPEDSDFSMLFNADTFV